MYMYFTQLNDALAEAVPDVVFTALEVYKPIPSDTVTTLSPGDLWPHSQSPCHLLYGDPPAYPLISFGTLLDQTQ